MKSSSTITAVKRKDRARSSTKNASTPPTLLGIHWRNILSFSSVSAAAPKEDYYSVAGVISHLSLLECEHGVAPTLTLTNAAKEEKTFDFRTDTRHDFFKRALSGWRVGDFAILFLVPPLLDGVEDRRRLPRLESVVVLPTLLLTEREERLFKAIDSFAKENAERYRRACEEVGFEGAREWRWFMRYSCRRWRKGYADILAEWEETESEEREGEGGEVTEEDGE